ncbi:hypothetical protein TNCV_194051 [Trichonephila clavipes]|nr:hypothetical protein TNCV_194051 [Trichonephila clavipes]
MPPAWRSQIEAQKIHRGKGLDVRLSLAVALSPYRTSMPQRHYTQLQTSLSSSGFEPIPYGTADIVVNHYTEGATLMNVYRVN